MNDSTFRILAPNIVGLSVSLAEVEQGLRIFSLIIGISLTIAAYYRSEKRKKKDQ